MAYQLGIDLGDASTTAAIRDLRAPGSGLRPVTFPHGGRVLPSELYVDQQGALSADLGADLAQETRQDLVVRNFVQLIGDPSAIKVDDRAWTGQDLTAQFVRGVVVHVTQAEAGPPTRTAASHPAGWSVNRVNSLKDALLNLGLAVTMVPGPLGAALSWGDVVRLNPGAMIVVYDLGASKLDVAVLRRTTSSVEIVGNPECRTGLGGNYFDDVLFDWVRTKFAEQFEAIDHADPVTITMIGQLRRRCTIAKEALSFDSAVLLPIRLPGFGGEVRLERSEFENLIRPTVAQTVGVLQQVIASVDVLGHPDTVLIVGGSAGVPLVSELVADGVHRLPVRPARNLTAAGALLALADRPLEQRTPRPDLPAPRRSSPPAGPATRPNPLDRRWRRSDLIAAGSLIVALLALLYSPAKDFLAERDKKSVVMHIGEIHWSMDGTAPGPRSLGEGGEGPDVRSTPGATSGPARATIFETIRVYGSSQNIPGDQDLWVVLRPADDGRFYPIGRAPISEDGAWTLPGSVCLPRPGTYGVFAYLTTGRSAIELAAWVEKEEKKTPDQVQGMPSLPPELMLLASQSVNRPIGRTGAGVCTPPEPSPGVLPLETTLAPGPS